MHIVPGSAVIFVLSNMCSEISASCFETSLEHFKHLIGRKWKSFSLINILIMRSISRSKLKTIQKYWLWYEFYSYWLFLLLFSIYWFKMSFYDFLLTLHVLITILHDSNRMSSLDKQDFMMSVERIHLTECIYR